MKAMLDCSSLGLEPDGRRCHLIPYGTEVQLIVDWKGLVELAKRSGEVVSWKAETVKERDSFDWQTGEITHSINWREDRGKLQAVYSIVKLSNGEIDTEVMTLAEVEAIRKRSKAGGSGPWVTDFEEMAKKTVIRRHSKRLTLSPEFHQALEIDSDKLAERDRAKDEAANVSFDIPAIETNAEVLEGKEGE
jgi:recombination protein RecT